MESVFNNIAKDFADRLGVVNKNKSTYEVIIDSSTCIKCSQCINACLPGALGMNNDNITYDSEKCTRCGLCAEACSVSAIKINR